ncbi:MAG: ATP-dependent helicase [Anaerolineaceae bacterium]
MSNKMENWYDNLEGEAYDIVASNERYICVHAGPGTGKSYTIKKRIMRLLQEGVDPEEIFACTFTNVSANDLKKDIKSLGSQHARKVKASTIHSFCLDILLSMKYFTTYGRKPKPLLEFEKEFMLHDLKRSKGVDWGGYYATKRKVNEFEAAWARTQSQEPGWPTNDIDKKFQSALENWLRFHDCMLIGELVPLTLQYLKTVPHAPIFNQYKYILVDEYQDLNKAEQDLIDLIAKNSNLMVVGDVDQSIYSFKYASSAGILDFPNRYPSTKQFDLTTCRRCPKKTVEMANKFISSNPAIGRASLFPFEEKADGEIIFLQWKTLNEEIEGIARVIERMELGGENLGEILVLCPSSKIASMIHSCLEEHDIPVTNFYIDMFKNTPSNLEESIPLIGISFLDLLINPEDRVALRCLLGYTKSGLQCEQWKKVMIYSGNTRISPFKVLEGMEKGQIDIGCEIPSLLTRFIKVRNEIERLKTLSKTEIIESLFTLDNPWSSQIRAYYSALDDKENLVLTDISTRIKEHFGKEDAPNEYSYVRIMSLHKSKGLTCNTTFITNFVQGLIPRNFDPRSVLTENEDLEEKRRLFYVAMTRHEVKIFITNSVAMDPSIARHRKVNIPVSGYIDGNQRTNPSEFVVNCQQTLPDPIDGDLYLSRSLIE